MLRRILAVAAVLVLLLSWPANAQTTVIGGLHTPIDVITTELGNIIVAEAGTGAQDGRISLVTPEGQRYTLVDGLPSGLAPPNFDPSGPSALLLRGRTLYIALGAGDTAIPGPFETELPNPAPSAPIFSSILALDLPAAFEQKPAAYTLTAEDVTRLAAGEAIEFGRAPRARLELVANFPDATPSPRPQAPLATKSSNPFGMEFDRANLIVADASLNLLWRVDVNSGEFASLVTFPVRPNPLPFGPPVFEAVPTSVRSDRSRLLVSFLSGFPFPPGAAWILDVDVTSGSWSVAVGGLTMLVDFAVAAGGRSSTIYTVEFSTEPLAGGPGRLQRHTGGTATVISDTLITPTSVALGKDSLYVTELATGRILRFPLQ